MFKVEKIGYSFPAEVVFRIIETVIEKKDFGWGFGYTQETDYFLHKDGSIRTYAVDTTFNTVHRSSQTGLWATRKEAEQFLKDWPVNFPELFAEYVTKQMEK